MDDLLRTSVRLADRLDEMTPSAQGMKLGEGVYAGQFGTLARKLLGGEETANLDEAAFWNKTAQVVGMGNVESEGEFRQNLALMEIERQNLQEQAETAMEFFGAEAAAQFAPAIRELDNRIARARQAIVNFEAAVGEYIADTNPVFDDAADAIASLAETNQAAAELQRGELETQLHGAQEVAESGLGDILSAIGADNPILAEDVQSMAEQLFSLASQDIEAQGAREDQLYQRMEEAADAAIQYGKAQNILDARTEGEEVKTRLTSSIDRMIDQRKKLSAEQSQAVAKARAAAAGQFQAQRNFDADSYATEFVARWLNTQSGFTGAEVGEVLEAWQFLQNEEGVKTLYEFKQYLGQQGKNVGAQRTAAALDQFGGAYDAVTTSINNIIDGYENVAGDRQSMEDIRIQWTQGTGLTLDDLEALTRGGRTTNGLTIDQVLDLAFDNALGFHPIFNSLNPEAGIVGVVEAETGRTLDPAVALSKLVTVGQFKGNEKLAALATLTGVPGFGITRDVYEQIASMTGGIAPDIEDALLTMYHQYDQAKREWESNQAARQTQEVFKPFGSDLSTLVYDAALYITNDQAAAQEWARSGAVHEIIQRESGGRVGVVNRRAAGRNTGNPNIDFSLWRDKVSDGTLRNTAYGLGQLKGYHWETYAKEFGGYDAIGDPFAEAVAFLRYLQGRYGTPQRALEFWLTNGWY